jgi:hypothetical protein
VGPWTRFDYTIMASPNAKTVPSIRIKERAPPPERRTGAGVKKLARQALGAAAPIVSGIVRAAGRSPVTPTARTARSLHSGQHNRVKWLELDRTARERRRRASQRTDDPDSSPSGRSSPVAPRAPAQDTPRPRKVAGIRSRQPLGRQPPTSTDSGHESTASQTTEAPVPAPSGPSPTSSASAGGGGCGSPGAPSTPSSRIETGVEDDLPDGLARLEEALRRAAFPIKRDPGGSEYLNRCATNYANRQDPDFKKAYSRHFPAMVQKIWRDVDPLILEWSKAKAGWPARAQRYNIALTGAAPAPPVFQVSQPVERWLDAKRHVLSHLKTMIGFDPFKSGFAVWSLIKVVKWCAARRWKNLSSPFEMVRVCCFAAALLLLFGRRGGKSNAF